MTEIERKALELVNEIEREEIYKDFTSIHKKDIILNAALHRAIEQHEAFRQEVSDAAEHLCKFYGVPIVMQQLERFIIAKPDPLVIEAREILASMCENQRAAQDWRDGTNDFIPGMELVLAGIKRGMELATEKSDD